MKKDGSEHQSLNVSTFARTSSQKLINGSKLEQMHLSLQVIRNHPLKAIVVKVILRTSNDLSQTFIQFTSAILMEATYWMKTVKKSGTMVSGAQRQLPVE